MPELYQDSRLPGVPPGGLGCSRDRGALTFELSGQYIIHEREVRWGLRAVLNVARYLGMIDGEVEPPGGASRISGFPEQP
jgi:predicted deacylase